MALEVPKFSFAGGELDPALHERTTLDKYRNGLVTGRNVLVTKIGSITSRMGRSLFVKTKLDDSLSVTFSPPGSGMVIEWGHLYARGYNYTTGVLLWDTAHALTEDDIPTIHFEASGSYLFIFCEGKTTLKLLYTTGAFASNIFDFTAGTGPVSAVIIAAGTPTGYPVKYAVTFVVNGQESSTAQSAAYNLPILAGQSNLVTGHFALGSSTSPNAASEMKVYRKPSSGGAYGYIGSGSVFTLGVDLACDFIDLGQDADYTHSPPALITIAPNSSGVSLSSPIYLLSKTGIVYQQRLLLSDAISDLEAICASRPGYYDNFWRNYPIDNASALKFKAGTSGYAKVLRFLDSDGLVVFTSAGIYLNQGDLIPDNIGLAKKGRWIIKENLPALPVPGGVLFVDAATNSVRNLLFNLQTEAYQAEEVSIYSNHLFKTRAISSWNFQEGAFPLLWVVFSDGEFASFTFEFDQQMKAWTRHDSASTITVESSSATIAADKTFFVVKKVTSADVTERYIEVSIPRYPLVDDILNNPEYDKNQSIAYMDSVVSSETLLNDSLLGDDMFALNATDTVEPPDWSLELNLNCGTSGIFDVGMVGEVFRYFDSDGAAYDFEVTAFVDANNLTVLPDQEFPESLASDLRLYQTAATFTGLDHMEGEYPSVIVDGAVVCSPNNDKDSYPAVQVVGGSLTLPNSKVGAIVHIGRPIVGDIETLDIDTVEQAPTLIESLTVNKIYIKVHESQGLFVGNKFSDDDGVVTMESLDQYLVDYEEDTPIIGNRAPKPQTKRVELTLNGDWRSQGKICIRQVDPLHFEILSIIPDCEILTRSDR